MSNYKKWWAETPGAMTLLHYAIIIGAATLGLLYVKPLWGFVALIFWLISTAGMMQICVAWDLGK